VLLLDECANVVPLRDLSSMLSEVGGRGLQVICVFHDLSRFASSVGRELEVAHASVIVPLAVARAPQPTVGSIDAGAARGPGLRVGQNFWACGWSKGFSGHAVALLKVWWLFGTLHAVGSRRSVERCGGA
jgi:hypothetical protein